MPARFGYQPSILGTTIRAYRADIGAFLKFVGRPLRLIRLADVQAYLDTLLDLKPASQRRKISTIKSLLTFAQKLGHVQFNAGAAVKQPRLKNTLAQRIL